MQNPGSKDQIWKWERVGGGREGGEQKGEREEGRGTEGGEEGREGGEQKGEREGGERNRRGRGKIDKKRKEREERRVWTDWSNMAVHYTPRKASST